MSIPKPGKVSSQSTSYRPIWLIKPAAKVLEALVLPALDQHGFRHGHSTISTLLNLTTDIASEFNLKKPPHQTTCVTVDLTASLDTVFHNTLISKITRSSLPDLYFRWLSYYLRGRQARANCRGEKSKARIVHADVPKGSKLSPTLFSFYLADMPISIESLKRICYADDITVYGSGVKITELEI